MTWDEYAALHPPHTLTQEQRHLPVALLFADAVWDDRHRTGGRDNRLTQIKWWANQRGQDAPQRP